MKKVSIMIDLVCTVELSIDDDQDYVTIDLIPGTNIPLEDITKSFKRRLKYIKDNPDEAAEAFGVVYVSEIGGENAPF